MGRGRRDRYYLNVGRVVTVVGILIGIGTAFIASGYSNIMNYIQLLFSFFNAPLFATFILAMFWKRTTPWSGVAGLAAGTIGAAVMHFAGYHIAYFYPHQVYDPTHATINAQMLNFYGAIAAFVADLVVTVLVTLVTKPMASHININLWMGIGMLIIGVFFTVWWRLRPLQHEPPPPDQAPPNQPEPDATRTGQ